LTPIFSSVPTRMSATDCAISVSFAVTAFWSAPGPGQ
jgi:hypothetical protein